MLTAAARQPFSFNPACPKTGRGTHARRTETYAAGARRFSPAPSIPMRRNDFRRRGAAGMVVARVNPEREWCGSPVGGMNFS